MDKKIDVKMQRRRLSVAPDQVGDVSQFQRKRRISAVSESHIPTRDPKKFVAISKKGYVPYNKNKVNQDSYFCDYNFDDNENVRLFGVCDGHGEYGHNVSALVARKIPKYIKACDYKKEPRKAIETAVAKVAETLRKSNINTTFSGTTMVFSLIVDKMVYTANLGDSRAIIVAVDSETNKAIAKPLSFDHKPNLPEEEQRILQAGGRVAPLPGPVDDDPGPYRVWLADIDVPGLAMSRSLGDDVAHSVGVSHIPEITEHEIRDCDEFMMFASDGVWEFIPNDEAAPMVYEKMPDLREAALKIVKESISRWRDEEEVIDDITAVIFNLKSLKNEHENKTMDINKNTGEEEEEDNGEEEGAPQ